MTRFVAAGFAMPAKNHTITHHPFLPAISVVSFRRCAMANDKDVRPRA